MTQEEQVEYKQLKRLFEETVTSIRTIHCHWDFQLKMYGHVAITPEEHALAEKKLTEYEQMSKRLRELIFK